MTHIFISYRREDSEDITSRICDWLRKTFGKANVYLDVDSNEPGIDFQGEIIRRINKSHVVLVVIGKKWLSLLIERDKREADGKPDFVKYEIEMALSLSKKVIPVLVGGATMPGLTQLPPK